MRKIAVVLSGSGYLDGSEIQEAVLTLLAIENAGQQWTAFCPNIEQSDVINHLDTSPTDTNRNALAEAARIVRGEVSDLAGANADEFDACIIVGGYGVAKSLTTFASDGFDFTINTDLEKFLRGFLDHKKPVGFMCISPILITKLCDKGTQFTIGNNSEMSTTISEMGFTHKNCESDDIVTDPFAKVVSTPAKMLDNNLVELSMGIEKLVKQVLALI